MATSLEEALASGKFLATASVDPPKGTALEGLGQLLERLKGVVDGLGVSDNHQGIMCMSPWAVCKLALEAGLEPIMHMTCRDRNRLALQSDLLAAASMGIRNILCVSGDHVRFGDHVDAKPVHDIDSVHLLTAAKGLAEGKDMAGNALGAAPGFLLGGVANPEADPLEPQLMKVDKKIRAGASFLITHPVFNMENLKRFMGQVRKSPVKVLVGIRLLDPEEIGKYRNGGYPGLFVPEKVLEEIQGAGIEKCAEMAVAAVKEIKGANLCDGVHVVAPGHEERIPEILEAGGV
ncbi:MAG: methylenetetrahydrofolate reductase [Thermodesulfobacteriota bacterium]|nr:methylenetetrahydrofolate reductase [Thermodesulfobacteriota bacterium]